MLNGLVKVTPTLWAVLTERSCDTVANQSRGWTIQRRSGPHGERCSPSSRPCTRPMPAVNTTGSSPCWRSTAATSRTTSHSWKTCPASCSVRGCRRHPPGVVLMSHLLTCSFWFFLTLPQRARASGSAPWPASCPLATSWLGSPSASSIPRSTSATAPGPRTRQSREC